VVSPAAGRWTDITSGAGTASVNWAMDWGTDSLIMGENLLCAVTLESDAAGTNNLGLGTPFAGSMQVYPVYCLGRGHTGVAGEPEDRLFSIQFKLRQNAPNPFNKLTVINYQLPKTGQVSLAVYNISGQRVKTLVEQQQQQAGAHSVTWNGRDGNGRTVANGVYLYRLQVGSTSLMGKMTMLK
jgi:hypothetical protein